MQEITNEQFVQGLRELADFYAANPEMPMPSYTSMVVNSFSKDQFVSAVRVLARGGKVEKRTDDDKSIMKEHYAIRTFGGLKLDVAISKSMVCRKVRKMVEMEVWECPDSLLAEA
ncbi:MAG: hypothetical protein ABSC23_03605 [Bryobacteraceae bacterium]|jgi:hypothetical protein